MSKTAEKSDPKLWETVKEEVTASDKGGNPGQWSARKAQLASSEYQKRGGGYEGEKGDDNHLQEWTDEEWDTKSGKPSGETGERYLPKEAREDMSDAEYAKTTAKKRADTRKGQQHSKQPEAAARTTAEVREHGGSDPTKAELMEEARARDVEGRSTMSKAELEKALDAEGTSQDGGSDRTKAELMEEARAQDVAGRSTMSKAELAKAVDD